MPRTGNPAPADAAIARNVRAYDAVASTYDASHPEIFNPVEQARIASAVRDVVAACAGAGDAPRGARRRRGYREPERALSRGRRRRRLGGRVAGLPARGRGALRVERPAYGAAHRRALAPRVRRTRRSTWRRATRCCTTCRTTWHWWARWRASSGPAGSSTSTTSGTTHRGTIRRARSSCARLGVPAEAVDAVPRPAQILEPPPAPAPVAPLVRPSMDAGGGPAHLAG